jgi:hypothetical protein
LYSNNNVESVDGSQSGSTRSLAQTQFIPAGQCLVNDLCPSLGVPGNEKSMPFAQC